ncbi:GTPase domain-containing protein [Helicobacter pullorum]|uniref:GTPase domain-containing protein n=1 Tax=Helicobacter pullorum TaxID=35818 RepID=UPI000CF14E01|nr:GTPase domain-containing protein [Helicobacter pullorum]
MNKIEEAGTKILLRGHAGAGKTTIKNLLIAEGSWHNPSMEGGFLKSMMSVFNVHKSAEQNYLEGTAAYSPTNQIEESKISEKKLLIFNKAHTILIDTAGAKGKSYWKDAEEWYRKADKILYVFDMKEYFETNEFNVRMDIEFYRNIAEKNNKKLLIIGTHKKSVRNEVCNNIEAEVRKITTDSKFFELVDINEQEASQLKKDILDFIR